MKNDAILDVRHGMRRQITWQKQEQCWTKDSWVQQEQKTMQQEREEVFLALQYAASFHCLLEELKDCEELWLAEREEGLHGKKRVRIRGIERRCGRGSKYMKVPGKCTAPKVLAKKFEKWRR